MLNVTNLDNEINIYTVYRTRDIPRINFSLLQYLRLITKVSKKDQLRLTKIRPDLQR